MPSCNFIAGKTAKDARERDSHAFLSDVGECDSDAFL